jgi:antimicrobial peptide system SdpA family protein
MNVGNAASPTDAPYMDPVDRRQDQDDARLGQRVTAVGVCALLFVIYVLHAALPATPFELPARESKSTVRAVMPQGWAFFTKSPRSQDPVVYQHETTGLWRNITAGPLAKPTDLMGLDRMARAQGTELAILLAAVPVEAWRDCSRDPVDCLSEMRTVGAIHNESNHHTVCGEAGFVIQEKLPWAWRHAPTTMPSKVLRVRVTC